MTPAAFPSGSLPVRSAAERESFLAAITRHRRASWRVTAACAVAVVVLATVVAVLLAPLLYCLIGLAYDLVNLATPAPDLMGWLFRYLNSVFSSRGVQAEMVARVCLVAAIPGFVLMMVMVLGLRHAWRKSPLFTGGDVPGREPNHSLLAEERLSNVVEEMAIAAGIPVPRTVIVPGGANAAACGRDSRHVTILAGEALAAGVSRDQLEGIVAHLVGSIANGDMEIGLRVTTTLALFGLVARVGGAFSDREAFWQTARLWRLLVAPTASGTIALLGALADPFSDTGASHQPRAVRHDGSLTWREWLVMPLMGPLVITGFLSAMISAFVLQPLIALAWRQRKYMADATAVELTRDPDGLASALAAIEDTPSGIVPWTAHLAVAPSRRGGDGPLGQSMVPVFPSLKRREAALARLGAHVSIPASARVPWPLKALFAGLLGIGAALMGLAAYLLVILSAALSGMFTIMPAALLHALLRAIAHR